ncbi:hypothetical protein K461DRAFT_233650 [Myriangium duriaei CBS 260.36]|uniref:Cyclin-D1-binding protein 1-like N-terminal domain-containing protein n=1 Tax=Myriangium duriaei CBS 260.36 TaxID=1168546 RepID=A0A9P4ISS1_9PEZI|nr:hypothetical protein K461DRAFT_233650 [Myriangium duriaei CBS 260.36]
MPPPKDLPALLDHLRTSTALITQCLTLLPNSEPLPSTSPPPNPLHVLKDAALLLKSHTTKLSLLLLTPPFTPSAILSVLRTITASVLPALLSAAQLCAPDVWGALLRAEVNARVAAALRGVEACLLDVRGVADQVASGKQAKQQRDTLASCGVVWEACDALVELEELDVAGVALGRAKGYQALIKDALEELKGWREESVADEGDDDEDDEDEEDDDDIFGSGAKLPRDRPELLLALDDALGKIKRVELLYTALSKRRVKTFTKDKARIRDHVRTMDALVDGMKRMPEITDELASAFYELDDEGVEEHKKALVEEARRTIQLVSKSWDGNEDEFTAWSTKWLEVMK